MCWWSAGKVWWQIGGGGYVTEWDRGGRVVNGSCSPDIDQVSEGRLPAGGGTLVIGFCPCSVSLEERLVAESMSGGWSGGERKQTRGEGRV